MRLGVTPAIDLDHEPLGVRQEVSDEAAEPPRLRRNTTRDNSRRYFHKPRWRVARAASPSEAQKRSFTISSLFAHSAFARSPSSA